jgi:ribosomal protein L7Ae-like RNA K-turn-binding protein
MARKSGQVVSGSNMVLETLDSKVIALVLLAEDVSPAIAEKVLGRAARFDIPCQRLYDKALLGQVLGKGERSVVALKTGLLADSMIKELYRYKRIVGES